MNKTQLISEVSKNTGIPQKTVRDVMNSMAKIIQDKLILGVNVKIAEFLSFTLITRAETRRRNPNTGEEIIVPKRYGLKIKLPTSFSKRLSDKKVYDGS